MMPSARPKSLVVSVLPVPAGPVSKICSNNLQLLLYFEAIFYFAYHYGNLNFKHLPAGPPPIIKCKDCVSVM